jgi:chromosome partitioning protein
MPRTYVWWSESGGAGKTTNAMNSAAAIGRDGYDVLALDLDPQRGALTHYAGFEQLSFDPEEGPAVDTTAMDVFFGDADPRDVIVETPHFSLFPGHERLSNFGSNLNEAGLYGMDQFTVVRNVIENLADEFDYFVIDAPATLGDLVDNAVFAARNVMVPLELSAKGEASQDGLEATVGAMQSGFDSVGVDIAIAGAVPSRVDDAKIFRQYREQFEERGVPLSPFSIPEHSLLRYTWDERMDIYEFQASKETRSLRDYESHVPLAYKIIGRWMTDDLTYDEVVQEWQDIRDIEMGDAEPEAVMNNAGLGVGD